MLHEVDGELPALGILGGADIPLRLEEHDVVVSASFLDPSPVDPHIVALGVDEAWEPLDHLPIHGHRPLLDQGLTGPPGGDPGIRQHALDADSSWFR